MQQSGPVFVFLAPGTFGDRRCLPGMTRLLAVLLLVSGCGSAPVGADAPSTEAPEAATHVPATCPRRAILPECFQRSRIRAAM